MADRFVSPTGSAGNPGTIAEPWSLAHAIAGAGGVIAAGDTVWMRGGTYRQSGVWVMTVAVGTLGVGVDDPTTKVKWRNYPLELVSICTFGDGEDCFRQDGSYNWLWATVGRAEGIEFWRDVDDRTDTRGTAYWFGDTPQTGNKLIHIVTRDGANGVLNGGFDPNYDYGELELYGGWTYNNGDEVPPRTHGLYIRHQGTTTKLRVSKYVSFNQLGHCIQVYSERDDGLRNIEIEDCFAWGAGGLGTLVGSVFYGTLFGGLGGNALSPLRGCKCNRNLYFNADQDSAAGLLHLGTSTATSEDVECQDNLMVAYAHDQTFGMVRIFNFVVSGAPSLKFDRNEMIPIGDSVVVENLQAGSLANYTSWTANKWYTPPPSTNTGWRQAGVNKTFSTWKADTGLGVTDTADVALPTITRTIVKLMNKYNPGYGVAAFVNFAMTQTVQMNLSPILAVGDQYEVYNVQDLFGEPVLSGVYGGGNVAFPTDGVSPPFPRGLTPRPPVATHPRYDVFFVKKIVPVVVPAADCVTPSFSFASPTTPDFTPECSE